MKIRAALVDFDGTTVTEDMLDVILRINGKEQESAELNRAFHQGLISGIDSLRRRYELIRGVSIAEINKKVEQTPYLREGARDLFNFFRENNIMTILYSGSLIPVLEHYQQALGIDHVVGTIPIIKDGVIVKVTVKKGFKLQGCKAILELNGVKGDQVIAIGDSPSDINVFKYVAVSLAVEPKGGIESYATYRIKDLREAIPIIQDLMKE